jgi:uncharacterized membrane-anchored protein
MTASIVLSIALYLSMVMVSKTIDASINRRSINATKEAILTALAWGLFYYLA